MNLTERNQQIRLRLEAGEPLEKVADAYCLSPRRVAEIAGEFCQHPADQQIHIGTRPHPVMGMVKVYACQRCGRQSTRLIVNDVSIADLSLGSFRVKASQMLREAIIAGLIERPDTCERCGNRCDHIDGHHYDYARPLEVEWLCPKCHSAADKARREAEKAA